MRRRRRQQQSQSSSSEGGGGGEEIAKIAALGVHLRRHVTSLGTALNLTTPPPSVTDEAVSPWARIVACGLEGRGVTSVAGEIGIESFDVRLREAAKKKPARTMSRLGLFLAGEEDGAVVRPREERVAGFWAEELSGRIGAQGVEEVDGEEVVELMERLVGSEGTEEERGYLERVREAVWWR